MTRSLFKLFLPARGPMADCPPSGGVARLFAAFGELRRASPVMFAMLSGVYLALLLLAIWVPANDFDTMSSYLCAVKLEEFGPIRQTATMEMQYVFPRFFDRLHAPFLKLGWFHAFPTFALFTACVALVVGAFERPVPARWLLGLAAAAPVLVGVTSAKNDLALALFAFLAWYAIHSLRPSAAWYPAVCLLASAALVGTKWFGLLVAPLLLGCLGWQLARERAITRRAVLVTLLALPALWWVSSAETYLDNLRYDGQLCPVPPIPDHLRMPPGGFARNAASFAVNNALETFEVPLYVADYKYLDGRLWPHLKRLTFDGKAYTYAVAPHSHIAAFGFPMLLVVGACVVAVVRRGVPGPVRASAAVALVYLVCCFESFAYSTWVNRYFLVTYVMGLLPLAHLTAAWRPGRAVRLLLAGWVAFVCYQSLAWNMEKPLVKRNLYYANVNQRYEKPSIFPRLADRDRLYYVVWTGHEYVHDYLRANVAPADPLLIVNRYARDGVPFLYPHLKDRRPENTLIVSDRFGQAPPPGFEDRFEFVMVFDGGLANPRYAEAYRFADVVIYRRLPTPTAP